MPQEIKNRPSIIYSPYVESYLNELITTLLEKGYFGFMDSALQYVTDMLAYIDRNIVYLPKYPAPEYFSKYEKYMQYVAYKPNKRTTMIVLEG